MRKVILLLALLTVTYAADCTEEMMMEGCFGESDDCFFVMMCFFGDEEICGEDQGSTKKKMSRNDAVYEDFLVIAECVTDSFDEDEEVYDLKEYKTCTKGTEWASW